MPHINQKKQIIHFHGGHFEKTSIATSAHRCQLDIKWMLIKHDLEMQNLQKPIVGAFLQGLIKFCETIIKGRKINGTFLLSFLLKAHIW